MANNGSVQHISPDQQLYENLVKIIEPLIYSGPFIVISIVGLVLFLILTLVFIILSPMLIILSPVLVPFSFILWMCLYITGEHPVGVFVILSPVLAPASFIFWVCLYVTGEHPIGADWVDETLKKIVEVTEDIYVKNKVES
ncbi:hypothetical protein LXL04_029819 [Taraxacum kok-saghyz]